mmetsp:Transcript_151052/g.465924  ORF Transcript_151052/g.465924 Transcript_151052/m.465924 type:complete len:217 (+) Transcript_151052:633-1283(+)
MLLPVAITSSTSCQSSWAELNCTEHNVASAEAPWYLSLGSKRKPSYWPRSHLLTVSLSRTASLASLRDEALGSMSTSVRTCSKWLCTMSRTWPTPSKKPPRPSRPRVSYSVTTTFRKVFPLQSTPRRGCTSPRSSGSRSFMKKESQWSTRCRLASGTPAARICPWRRSASSRLVPKGFSAATWTRCFGPSPQLSTAAFDQEPKTKGGMLRYTVTRS